MEGIMKLVKFLECSSLLIKGITKTIEKEAKAKKGCFFGLTIGT